MRGGLRPGSGPQPMRDLPRRPRGLKWRGQLLNLSSRLGCNPRLARVHGVLSWNTRIIRQFNVLELSRRRGVASSGPVMRQTVSRQRCCAAGFRRVHTLSSRPHSKQGEGCVRSLRRRHALELRRVQVRSMSTWLAVGDGRERVHAL